MNNFILTLSVFFALILFFIIKAHHSGAVQTIKHIITLSFALAVSGIAVRIGSAFAPKLQQLTFIFAGAAALFFYAVLNIGFNGGLKSRFHYISVSSRRFACLLSLIESWLILSFLFFYLSHFFLIYPQKSLLLFRKIGSVILWPIELFWFFPR